MNKYLVTLGCNKPIDWEAEVEAKNAESAVNKAFKLFHDSPLDWGEFVEVGEGAVLIGNDAVWIDEVSAKHSQH